MPLGIAILLTLLASTLTRIAVVLLKHAISAAGLTRKTGVQALILALVHSPWAMLGLAMEVLGVAFYLAAVASQAPISVLQPLRGFGVIVMAFLAVAFLKERLRGLEWLGVVVLLAGIVLLSVSIRPAATGAIRPAPLLIFLAIAGFLGLALVPAVRTAHAASGEEVIHGTGAGLLLGSGYLHIKIFFLAWHDANFGLMALAAAAVSGGLISGLIVLVCSFRWSRVLIVTTVNLVVNQVFVILGGWICLGEQLPSDSLLFYARLAGFAATMGGITLLARFQATEHAPSPSMIRRDG